MRCDCTCSFSLLSTKLLGFNVNICLSKLRYYLICRNALLSGSCVWWAGRLAIVLNSSLMLKMDIQLLYRRLRRCPLVMNLWFPITSKLLNWASYCSLSTIPPWKRRGFFTGSTSNLTVIERISSVKWFWVREGNWSWRLRNMHVIICSAHHSSLVLVVSGLQIGFLHLCCIYYFIARQTF